jgi:hypothetical protein
MTASRGLWLCLRCCIGWLGASTVRRVSAGDTCGGRNGTGSVGLRLCAGLQDLCCDNLVWMRTRYLRWVVDARTWSVLGVFDAG